MHIDIFERGAVQCSSGTQYYTCASNGFSGCCSVDACNYAEGCPAAGAAIGSFAETIPSTVFQPKTTNSHSTTTSPGTTTSPATATATTTLATTTSGKSTSSSTSTSGGAPVPTGSGQPQPSSSGISPGAIAGIVTAGVLAFVLLAALVLWKMRRRNQQLQQQRKGQQYNGGQEDQEQHQPPYLGGPGGSPASQASPGAASENGSGGFQKEIAASSSSPEPYGALPGTPASSTIPLFGEAHPGDLEAAIARWGPHGARLAAQRRLQQMGSVRSQSSSQNGVADLGGSYLGPGSEPHAARLVAELEGDRAASPRAELETPVTTPMTTPQTGSYSPTPPSSCTMSSPCERSAFAPSSWRDSSRNMLSGSGDPITEEGSGGTTPDLASTAQMPGPAYTRNAAPPPPSSHSYNHNNNYSNNRQKYHTYLGVPGSSIPDIQVSPPTSSPRSTRPISPEGTPNFPRATLYISQRERTQGQHVTSFYSYQP